MYFLIETSPKGDSLIGNFKTVQDAEKKINELTPVGECVCDYYITKIIY